MPVKRMPQQSSFNDIHQFWFGEHDGLTPPADKADMWFGNGRAYDDTIRARFGALPDFAAAGSFDSWRDEPRSSLALILVLDQFPRHVHRDSARAFAYDAKAREVCLSGIATSMRKHCWSLKTGTCSSIRQIRNAGSSFGGFGNSRE